MIQMHIPVAKPWSAHEQEGEGIVSAIILYLVCPMPWFNTWKHFTCFDSFNPHKKPMPFL